MRPDACTARRVVTPGDRAPFGRASVAPTWGPCDGVEKEGRASGD